MVSLSNSHSIFSSAAQAAVIATANVASLSRMGQLEFDQMSIRESALAGLLFVYHVIMSRAASIRVSSAVSFRTVGGLSKDCLRKLSGSQFPSALPTRWRR